MKRFKLDLLVSRTICAVVTVLVLFRATSFAQDQQEELTEVETFESGETTMDPIKALFGNGYICLHVDDPKYAKTPAFQAFAQELAKKYKKKTKVHVTTEEEETEEHEHVTYSPDDDVEESEETGISKNRSPPKKKPSVKDAIDKTKKIRDENAKKTTCQEPGFFVHPKDCRKYHQCVEPIGKETRYKKFTFQCGPGTIFDEALSICNHAYAVKPKPPCWEHTVEDEEDNVEKDTPPAPGQQQQVIEEDIDDDPPPEEEDSNENDLKKVHKSPPKKPGKKDDDDDSWVPELPGTTKKDPEKLKKKKKEINDALEEILSKTKKRPKKKPDAPPSQLPEETTPTCSSSGTFPVEHDCKKYYTCIPDKGHYKSMPYECDDGQIFDPTEEECREEASVTPKPPCWHKQTIEEQTTEEEEEETDETPSKTKKKPNKKEDPENTKTKKPKKKPSQETIITEEIEEEEITESDEDGGLKKNFSKPKPKPKPGQVKGQDEEETEEEETETTDDGQKKKKRTTKTEEVTEYETTEDEDGNKVRTKKPKPKTETEEEEWETFTDENGKKKKRKKKKIVTTVEEEEEEENEEDDDTGRELGQTHTKPKKKKNKDVDNDEEVTYEDIIVDGKKVGRRKKTKKKITTVTEETEEGEETESEETGLKKNFKKPKKSGTETQVEEEYEVDTDKDDLIDQDGTTAHSSNSKKKKKKNTTTIVTEIEEGEETDDDDGGIKKTHTKPKPKKPKTTPAPGQETVPPGDDDEAPTYDEDDDDDGGLKKTHKAPPKSPKKKEECDDQSELIARLTKERDEALANVKELTDANALLDKEVKKLNKSVEAQIKARAQMTEHMKKLDKTIESYKHEAEYLKNCCDTSDEVTPAPQPAKFVKSRRRRSLDRSQLARDQLTNIFYKRQRRAPEGEEDYSDEKDSPTTEPPKSKMAAETPGKETEEKTPSKQVGEGIEQQEVGLTTTLSSHVQEQEEDHQSTEIKTHSPSPNIINTTDEPPKAIVPSSNESNSTPIFSKQLPLLIFIFLTLLLFSIIFLGCFIIKKLNRMTTFAISPEELEAYYKQQDGVEQCEEKKLKKKCITTSQSSRHSDTYFAYSNE